MVVATSLVEQLNEKVGRLRTVHDELRSGNLLRTVVSQANDREVWTGGPQVAFAGWLDALDRFVRRQLAEAVELVGKRVADHAAETAQAGGLAAGAGAVTPPAPARPVGSVPPYPPEFHLGKTHDTKPTMNPELMRRGLVRALGQAKDQVLDLSRRLTDALSEPSVPPPVGLVGPVVPVHHLPPDAKEAAGVPAVFTAIAQALDTAIQEVLDRANRWEQATIGDVPDAPDLVGLAAVSSRAAAAARAGGAAADHVLQARPSQLDKPKDPPLTPRQRKAADRIRDALDPGGWGVRRDDLIAIRKTLGSLPPEERDAVLASLSDKELERWFEQMQESRLKGGISKKERMKVFNLLAESVSLQSLRRVSDHSKWARDYLRPSLRGTEAQKEGGLGDVHWRSIGAPLLVQGHGDANSVDYSDIHQGALGDCYLLSAMAAISERDPEAISRMVRKNPNGTFTVTFHDGDDLVEIVVTNDFPMGPNDMPVFQGNGDSWELWPLVIEKAYAQWHGGYAAIEGGWPDEAMEQLTGRPADRVKTGDVSMAKIRRWLDEGRPLCVSTKGGDDDHRLGGYVAGHAYYVVGVEGDEILLRNPWGMQEGVTRMPMSDFKAYSDGVQVGAKP